MALAFLLGGGAYLVIEEVIERVQGGGLGEGGRSGMWMVYIAVAVDLFADGLLIGTGSAVGLGLAFVLALGQIMADIPEGFATVANFRDKGVPRTRRLLLSASFAVPVLLAAALGYWLLRGASDALKLSALVFTAGLLIVAAVEEMIGEAHESASDTRASVLAFGGGLRPVHARLGLLRSGLTSTPPRLVRSSSPD
jgi:ZIP family zinc transporter